MYSGKKLSEVPYDDIAVGMELISAIKNPGRVREKIDKELAPHRENDNWIIVDWDNGNQSYHLHQDYNFVTVK
jgi:hypothetical protein